MLQQVIDISSVPNCCKAMKFVVEKYCSKCGSKQPEIIEPTLMHGFQAKEDLRATAGCFGPCTIFCNNRQIEVPDSLTFNKKWPVMKTATGFAIDVATGSTDIKRALSSTEFVEAANSFKLACTQDDLVIRCPSKCTHSRLSHVQLCPCHVH